MVSATVCTVTVPGLPTGYQRESEIVAVDSPTFVFLALRE
jgi:hypothetical protein